MYPDEYRVKTAKKYDGKVVYPSDKKKYYEDLERLALLGTMKNGNRMYVEGAIYHQLLCPVAPELMPEVIDGFGRDLSIDVDLGNGLTTTIRVVDVSGRAKLLESAVTMCQSLFSDPYCSGGHVRKGENKGDLGRMATVGYFCGGREAYKTIRDSDHAENTRKVLGIMASEMKTMIQEDFPDELQEIQEAEKAQQKDHHCVSEMCGLASSFKCTENTASPSHIDLDASKSVAIWATSNKAEPANWFFVFSNVGRNGRMLVIKLHHGCAMSWDARVLRHCT